MATNLDELDLDKLEELDPRRAEDLARAISDALRGPPSEFNNRLIRATQLLQVEDPEVRQALSKSLFHAARSLRDRGLASEAETLWAAIRMASVLTREPAELAALTEFMHPGDSHQALQVSLQAIANVSNRGPLPIVPELRELAALVDAAANRFCHFELMAIPAVASLAISAVTAARALALPGVEVWKTEFELRPLLLRQLERELEELTERWPKAVRGLEADLSKPKLPRYPRLTIGQEFTSTSTGRRFRVTDVGLRSFLTVDLTRCEQQHPGDASWLNGPPYAVPEMVWDEYDFAALEGLDGLEWEEHGSGKSLSNLLSAVRTFARHWQDQDGAIASVIDAVVDAAEVYWGRGRL